MIAGTNEPLDFPPSKAHRIRSGNSPSPAPSAATEPGIVRCRHCPGVNSADQKYCSGCGSCLWEPCAECHTLAPAGARHCGQCGANLQQAAALALETAETQFSQAREFFAKAQFNSALIQLSLVAKSTAPGCQELARQAQQLLPQWQAEIVRQQNAVAERVNAARAKIDVHEYEPAIRLLAEVPEVLRSDELLEVLATAQARHQETIALTAQIKAAVASQQFDEALTAIARLLVLLPGHKSAREVAAKLQVRFLNAARKHLAAHQYREALRGLHKIPRELRTPEVQACYDQVAERDCLRYEIRNAPVVDAATLALAERLVRLSPGDEQAQELLARLQKQPAEAAHGKLTLPRVWATAPAKNAFNLPIDRVLGFEQIVPEALLASPLAARAPESFFVAAGLALQGLGLSALDTQFEPPKPKTASPTLAALGAVKNFAQQLTRRKGYSNKRTKAKSAWGLDLGPGGLRAIKLVVEGSPPKVVAKTCDLIEHSQNVALAESEAARIAIFAETLKIFAARHKLAGDRLGVGLAGGKVLARFFEMPPVPYARIDDAISYEAPHQFGVPLTDLAWDYELMGYADPDPLRGELCRVLFQATHRLHLTDGVEPFRLAGLAPDFVQCSAVALHNFMAYELFARDGPWQAAPPQERSPGVVLVDIGADNTNIVISDAVNTWFRSLPGGGQEFTRLVVKGLNCTHDQAERWKRNPAEAPSASRVFEALRPAFLSLRNEILRSLRAYEKSACRGPIARLVLLGGSSHLPGLWRFLRQAGEVDH